MPLKDKHILMRCWATGKAGGDTRFPRIPEFLWPVISLGGSAVAHRRRRRLLRVRAALGRGRGRRGWRQQLGGPRRRPRPLLPSPHAQRSKACRDGARRRGGGRRLLGCLGPCQHPELRAVENPGANIGFQLGYSPCSHRVRVPSILPNPSPPLQAGRQLTTPISSEPSSNCSFLEVLGSCTAAAATLDGSNKTLKVAHIGDAGFCVLRDGRLIQRSRPQLHGPNCPFQLGCDDVLHRKGFNRADRAS